ncbi:MAG: hypothetical protein OXC29_21375 [Rhodococcus sp.]|nr:hypothetical protein [Rhodococcus sp. (in: high G+C Gram-positive bacteria)]
MADDLAAVTEEILRATMPGATAEQQSADPTQAALFAGTVISQTGGLLNPVWQIADVESPTTVVTVRGYVRLLVESSDIAEGGRTLPVGTLVLAVARSGDYLLLGTPGTYL